MGADRERNQAFIVGANAWQSETEQLCQTAARTSQSGDTGFLFRTWILDRMFVGLLALLRDLVCWVVGLVE